MKSNLTVNEIFKAALEAMFGSLSQNGGIDCPVQVVNNGRVLVNVQGTAAQKQAVDNWLLDLAHVSTYAVDPRPIAALDNEPIGGGNNQFGGRAVIIDLFTSDTFQSLVGDTFEDARSKFTADIHEGQKEFSQNFSSQASKTLFYERYSPGTLLKTALKAVVTLSGKESNDSGKSEGISMNARQDCDQKFFGKEFPAGGIVFAFTNVMVRIRRGDHWFEFDCVSGTVTVEIVRSLVKDDERS